MPLFLLFVGVVLVVTGVRGTITQLGGLVKGDFEGPGNYTTWLFALLIAGAIGYIPGLKPLSYAFMLLIVVAVMLQKGTGFFSQLDDAMRELNQ